MNLHRSMSTPHLLLRPLADADAAPLFEFMRDAAAMQHTYVAPSLADLAARLAAYEAMRPLLGFAPWVACDGHSHDVIGWGGLSLDPDEPAWGLEVSYAFSPAVWGRGLATELVQASLAQAFAVLQAPEVHAFAKPANAASVRVLHKCGFGFLRHEPSLQRDHFLARAPGAA